MGCSLFIKDSRQYCVPQSLQALNCFVLGKPLLCFGSRINHPIFVATTPVFQPEVNLSEEPQAAKQEGRY